MDAGGAVSGCAAFTGGAAGVRRAAGCARHGIETRSVTAEIRIVVNRAGCAEVLAMGMLQHRPRERKKRSPLKKIANPCIKFALKMRTIRDRPISFDT